VFLFASAKTGVSEIVGTRAGLTVSLFGCAREWRKQVVGGNSGGAYDFACQAVGSDRGRWYGISSVGPT